MRGTTNTDLVAPSIRTLRGPIKTDRPPSMSELYRRAQSLAFVLEHGDYQTKAAAEVLAYRMIYEAMIASLYDPSREQYPGSSIRFATLRRRSRRYCVDRVP